MKKLLTKRPECYILYESLITANNGEHGSIAQLGEHLPYKQRVTGSSPVVPTIMAR